MVTERSRKGLCHLFNSYSHIIWLVASSNHNVCNVCSNQAFNLVDNHGSVGEFDQRLCYIDGLVKVRMMFSPLSVSCHNALQSLRSGGGMSTKGRRRVPKPPLRIRAIYPSQ